MYEFPIYCDEVFETKQIEYAVSRAEVKFVARKRLHFSLAVMFRFEYYNQLAVCNFVLR